MHNARQAGVTFRVSTMNTSIKQKHMSAGVGLLVIALSLSAPLAAKSIHTGISVHIGSGHYRIHGKVHRGHGLHRHHRHFQRHRGHRFRGHRSAGFGHRYFRSPRGCHPVSRYVYNRYGDLVKVRGTMCYDQFGRGYVVPGSRHAHRR